MRFRRLVPLLALAGGIAIVARVEGQSRPLVASAATALAAALAEMIAAREISESQALTMARGYLHDNAAALYQ